MSFIIFIVIVLFLLAIIDLIVGVSNDAVNFLNSAIGSKVANFKTIILIAAAGVILGSVFSSGLMEIARKGIFYPQFFTLDIVLWIFLAVMLTDIILLDIFNTLGLPTSTTVSIIFELLGASLVAGILFTIEKREAASEIMKYINIESVKTIITGIFLSILIAFTIGMIIQYFSRLIFTFNYEEKLSRYGAIFSGLGITAIVYFLLIKGLKGTTLVDPAILKSLTKNTYYVLGILFVASTAISLLLQKLAKINPLKIVVLMGTFSLAMAFAGNDLVNFIGVPITGFLAFKNWQSTGIPANEHYQDFLISSDIIVPNYMLLIAGGIMAVTLWTNAKARKVTETEVNLSSQSEGEERFQPNAISRRIVKSFIMLNNILSVVIPKTLRNHYNVSFEKSKLKLATVIYDKPAFDLVRAATNLVVASSLIAMATSMKLPLSTTYVTFMVAMGSSLADKAWGRESAVYRVAGVISVIGGWFITALIAFLVSGLFVLILIKAGSTGAIILLSIVAIYIISSHTYFARKEKKTKAINDRLSMLTGSDLEIYDSHKKNVIDTLNETGLRYNNVLDGLKNYDEKAIEKSFNKLKEQEEHGFKQRAQSIRHMKALHTHDIKQAEMLLFSADLLQDITHSAVTLAEEVMYYVKNLHRQPDQEFIIISEELRVKMDSFKELVTEALRSNNFLNFDVIKKARDDVREYINQNLEKQVELIQDKKPGTKEAILQTNVLLQSRDILAVTYRILKMYRQYNK